MKPADAANQPPADFTRFKEFKTDWLDYSVGEGVLTSQCRDEGWSLITFWVEREPAQEDGSFTQKLIYLLGR
jgi:hypothetical protein